MLTILRRVFTRPTAADWLAATMAEDAIYRTVRS